MESLLYLYENDFDFLVKMATNTRNAQLDERIEKLEAIEKVILNKNYTFY